MPTARCRRTLMARSSSCTPIWKCAWRRTRSRSIQVSFQLLLLRSSATASTFFSLNLLSSVATFSVKQKSGLDLFLRECPLIFCGAQFYTFFDVSFFAVNLRSVVQGVFSKAEIGADTFSVIPRKTCEIYFVSMLHRIEQSTE